MNNGTIGIFRCTEDGEQICSVSVRSSVSTEKLKKSVQIKHPKVKLELVKMFSFECNGEIVDVEKKLRELLVLAFGKYVPAYKEWECYKVDSKKIESFISDFLSLGKAITDFKELAI